METYQWRHTNAQNTNQEQGCTYLGIHSPCQELTPKHHILLTFSLSPVAPDISIQGNPIKYQLVVAWAPGIDTISLYLLD